MTGALKSDFWLAILSNKLTDIFRISVYELTKVFISIGRLNHANDKPMQAMKTVLGHCVAWFFVHFQALIAIIFFDMWFELFQILQSFGNHWFWWSSFKMIFSSVPESAQDIPMSTVNRWTPIKRYHGRKNRDCKKYDDRTAN